MLKPPQDEEILLFWQITIKRQNKKGIFIHVKYVKSRYWSILSWSWDKS